jgi:hypothetical protein
MTDLAKTHLELQRPAGPNDDPDCPEWFCVIDADSLWCDFKLIKAHSWGDTVMFPCERGEFVGDSSRGYHRSGETSKLSEARAEVTGFVKWDGCIELQIDNHMCNGARSVAELHSALQWMLTEAHQAMRAHPGRSSELHWDPVS